MLRTIVMNLAAAALTANVALAADRKDLQVFNDISAAVNRYTQFTIFDDVNAGVKDGVATIGGETYNDVGRDSALAIAYRMPGVKDVVNEIKVSQVSMFDDSLRVRAARVLYGDSVLSRYAIDPARPIRIIIDGGHVSLYGSVDSAMDKQIAGMRVGQVPGVFSVQNNLIVENGSKQGL